VGIGVTSIGALFGILGKADLSVVAVGKLTAARIRFSSLDESSPLVVLVEGGKGQAGFVGISSQAVGLE